MVHKRTTGIHTHKTHHDMDLGKPPPFPLYYFLGLDMGATLKCHFFRDSQVESPKILEIRTFAALEAHKFLCIPLIEVKSKEKL
jgi:hypothetical protein